MGSVWSSGCAVPQAYNYTQRLANARLVNSKLCRTTEGFGPNVTVLIDDLTPHNASGDNPVWCTYGQGPNMGFVIAPNGTVVLEQQWFSSDGSASEVAPTSILHCTRARTAVLSRAPRSSSAPAAS